MVEIERDGEVGIASDELGMEDEDDIGDEDEDERQLNDLRKKIRHLLQKSNTRYPLPPCYETSSNCSMLLQLNVRIEAGMDFR